MYGNGCHGAGSRGAANRDDTGPAVLTTGQ